MKNPLKVIFRPWLTQATTLREEDTWISHSIGGARTSSGQRINNDTAMAISTVYDCVRIIGEDLAKLPLPVMQELSSGVKEKRKDHPLFNVINKQANPEMTAMSFWSTIVSHAVGTGNGYAEKVRDRNGDIMELWPLLPNRVTPTRTDSGVLVYEVKQDDGSTVTLGSDKIFHVPGFGFDGIKGYNVVHVARESLGLAKGAEEFGAKFFGNGAKTSLAFTFPDSLKETAYKNLKKSIEDQVSGDNQHRVLLLEEGGDVKTLSLSQKDSQYLETREFSIEEICRWFRMPPHKVADLRRATFSNIEEQNIDFVTDTLMPWFLRFEQAIDISLLSPQDQADGFFVKFNANALLRGNAAARAAFYTAGINAGWLTRNEARAKEDLNPIDGLDDPLVPLNMTVVGEEPVETVSNDAFVEDVAGRIASAEERGLSARVDKASEDRERFDEWTYDFFLKSEEYNRKCLYLVCPSRAVLTDITVSGYSGLAASRHPAEHIKTWNRKQEIIDIINEALTCTHK